VVGARFRHFLNTFGPHRLLTSLQVDVSHNLDPHRQLLIGGDTGLRGYPRRFRNGDRRFLFTLEHRFYTGLELFNLVHVGAAAFFDVGGAWYGDDHTGLSSSELFKDVGVGLRLGSSRSADGAMIHFDVAYPLDGDSRKVQWLVTSKESF
jgi:hemolysin activation/secretion protein